MKSVPFGRWFAASLLLSMLAPSLSHAQTRAQMDSMYAKMQRVILKEYPEAIFPPVPYDQYDTVSEDYGEDRVDRKMKLKAEYEDACSFLFPEFETWDVYSAETKKDPFKQQYVVVTFFTIDPESGALMEGRASKILIRKKKKEPTAPDQYGLTSYDDGTAGVFTEPTAIERYSCERFSNCLPQDDPIAQAAAEYCAVLEAQESEEEGEEW